MQLSKWLDSRSRQRAHPLVIVRLFGSVRIFLALAALTVLWCAGVYFSWFGRVSPVLLVSVSLSLALANFGVYLARITDADRVETEPNESSGIPAEPIEVLAVDHPRWLEVALALLGSEVNDGALLRIGRAGVELYAPGGELVPPAPFLQTEVPGLWRVDPSVTLEDAARLAAASTREHAQVERAGEDDSGHYYVLSSSDDSDSTGGPSDVVVVDLDAAIVLEPYGLSLRRSISESDDDETAVLPAGPIGGPDSTSPSRQGPVEVRILRGLPDLVGDLVAEPTGAAVELVAYLATHDYKASMTKLRDSIGTKRAPTSSSPKVVWNAVGEPRRCLGARLFPRSSGQQLYHLSEEVTCDWTRFRALVSPGRDDEADRVALTEALELADGIPGEDSTRFGWLDTERLLDEISTTVLDASERLASLALAAGDRELASFAIGKARIFSALSGKIAQIERELGQLVTSTD